VNYTPCDPRKVFMQRMLRDAGYQTGSVGKLHFYPPTNEHARSTGFDRVLLDDGVASTDPYSDYVKWRKVYDPHSSISITASAKDAPPGANPYRAAMEYEYTPTHWIGEQTCGMLRDFCKSPKPFFLLGSFFKPHSPFQVPTPYDAMYNSVDIPLPPRVTLEDIRKLPLPLQRLILRGRPEYTITPDRLEWMYRSYYGAISMVDDEIGRILDELEASGRARNTIVIFAADHGAQLLEHGLMDKNVFFESSVHVPFLLQYPGRITPVRRDEFVEMVDVLPTILDFCGVPIPENVEGRSFAPLLTGSSGEYRVREVVFSENIIPEINTSRSTNMPFVPGQGVAGIRHPDAKMVRTSRWKLNYYPGHGAELFDLQNDPGEMRNLANEPAQRMTVCDLKQQLLDWMITADENEQIARRWLL
jgi:arylsulfatase A-like enzyme